MNSRFTKKIQKKNPNNQLEPINDPVFYLNQKTHHLDSLKLHNQFKKETWENIIEPNLKNNCLSIFSANGSISKIDSIKFKSLDFLKIHRRIINRPKRKKLINQYKILKSLWNCTSKVQLMHIFNDISPIWKKFLKFYLSRCFILHLIIRQLKKISELMRHRQNLFDSINEPELLVKKINFSNNLIKNFSKGVSNFIIMFYDELIRENLIPLPTNEEN